jgi:hypothetical protein
MILLEQMEVLVAAAVLAIQLAVLAAQETPRLNLLHKVIMVVLVLLLAVVLMELAAAVVVQGLLEQTQRLLYLATEAMELLRQLLVPL